MTKADEKELLRISEVLRTVHERVGDDALASEALKKAALALSLGFIHGLRPEIESHFAKLDLPLSPAEKADLRKRALIPTKKKAPNQTPKPTAPSGRAPLERGKGKHEN